jgi:hypothetical protein
MSAAPPRPARALHVQSTYKQRRCACSPSTASVAKSQAPATVAVLWPVEVCVGRPRVPRDSKYTQVEYERDAGRNLHKVSPNWTFCSIGVAGLRWLAHLLAHPPNYPPTTAQLPPNYPPTTHHLLPRPALALAAHLETH